MNSKQYLWQLRTLLTGKLKHDELERLMLYYYDYFSERGAEQEEAVMAELGTPEELAVQLLGHEIPRQDPVEEEPAPEPPVYYPPSRRKGMPLWVKIMLGFLLFPVIFVVVIAIFAVVVSFGAVALCLFGGGAMMVWAGISVVLQNGATTILFTGYGILSAALGIFMVLATLSLGKVSALGTGRFFQWLFQSKGAQR